MERLYAELLRISFIVMCLFNIWLVIYGDATILWNLFYIIPTVVIAISNIATINTLLDKIAIYSCIGFGLIHGYSGYTLITEYHKYPLLYYFTFILSIVVLIGGISHLSNGKLLECIARIRLKKS